MFRPRLFFQELLRVIRKWMRDQEAARCKRIVDEQRVILERSGASPRSIELTVERLEGITERYLKVKYDKK